MDKMWMVLFAAALSGSVGCSENLSQKWTKECVGRLQFLLPGEADQDAILGSERFQNRAQYGQPLFRFPDGEVSGKSEFLGMEITHPLTDKEKILATKKTPLKKNETLVEDIKTSSQGIVWYRLLDSPSMQYGSSRRVINADFLTANGVLLSWGSGVQEETGLLQSKSQLQTIAAGLRPRPLFDVPFEPGLCLPYVFIPDGGQGGHAIAMTYRLKEHPDITINLRSKTAESTPKEGDYIRPDAVTNDFQTDLYWGAYLANVVDARSLWHLPAKRPMHMAGRSGLETFLAVVRSKDSEEDYIYHAVARGDPDEPEKAPDVRLVVEQNRQNAIKRGIQPLTQDEVLKLSRQIAASVAVRKNK